MRIIFFGTSSFAARVLSHLIYHQFQVVAVVTRPDRSKGRSLALSTPPVKESLLQIGSQIPIYQPEIASTVEFEKILKSYEADLFVVVAYGEIVKKNILAIPQLGCINIHASLLPKYRGAAPIQRCLMDGETKTGITIIEMVEKMDAGDILAQSEIPIPEEMTFGILEDELNQLACSLIVFVLNRFEMKQIEKQKQDESKVSYAAKIKIEEEEIDWKKSALEIHHLIRALSPKPGAWTWIKIGDQLKRLKIKLAKILPDLSGKPGEILSFKRKEWIVACGEGALLLEEVQLEGKRNLNAEDFIKGIHSPLSFFGHCITTSYTITIPKK